MVCESVIYNKHVIFHSSNFGYLLFSENKREHVIAIHFKHFFTHAHTIKSARRSKSQRDSTINSIIKQQKISSLDIIAYYHVVLTLDRCLVGNHTKSHRFHTRVYLSPKKYILVH